MFTDIHRYLMQRHNDIQWLRDTHARKDKQRKDSIAECARQLEHDRVERAEQIRRFSDEMQRHTHRKMGILQVELEETDMMTSNKDTPATTHERKRLQFQIDRLSKELSMVRTGLCDITDSMEEGLCGDSCSEPETQPS
mmetsp:Transcript_7501/g.17783  ORF Transcript_7501/g.17783 Transcript_7501/m.17783 type:complete len:139 (+) Transcript_7501:3-419(+)